MTQKRVQRACLMLCIGFSSERDHPGQRQMHKQTWTSVTISSKCLPPEGCYPCEVCSSPVTMIRTFSPLCTKVQLSIGIRFYYSSQKTPPDRQTPGSLCFDLSTLQCQCLCVTFVISLAREKTHCLIVLASSPFFLTLFWLLSPHVQFWSDLLCSFVLPSNTSFSQ